MSEIIHCPDCEHILTDCGDVWHCPVCETHWTWAALAVEVLSVVFELAELL